MFQRNNVTAKVDHVLSQKDHLYVRFILNRDRLLNTSVHPNPISGTRTNLLPHQSMWLISDTRTLGPRLIADMRVNLNTSTAHTTSPGLGEVRPSGAGCRRVEHRSHRHRPEWRRFHRHNPDQHHECFLGRLATRQCASRSDGTPDCFLTTKMTTKRESGATGYDRGLLFG